MTPESEKILEKSRQELLDLHKRVLLNYLIGQGLEYPVYHKFFIIYDYYIDSSNVERYFYCPCRIFVRALLLNKLDLIDNMVDLMGSRRPRTKKSKRRVTRF